MYGLKTLDLLAYLYLYSWNPFYESYLDSEHIRKQTAFAEQSKELKQTKKSCSLKSFRGKEYQKITFWSLMKREKLQVWNIFINDVWLYLEDNFAKGSM